MYSLVTDFIIRNKNCDSEEIGDGTLDFVTKGYFLNITQNISNV